MKKPEGKHTFQIIKDFSQIDLDYTRTILPPRKIFLPPSFNMFKATEKKYEADFSHVSEKIIFGLHPCDIHAILIMDQFYEHHYNDPYYIEARNNTLILGHSCWPDEHCLCKSAGTDIIEGGYDLFFSELEKEYLVWIGSSKGDDLIRRKPDFFDEDITDKDIQKYIEWREEKDKAFSVSIDFKNMPDLMELKYQDVLWEPVPMSVPRATVTISMTDLYSRKTHLTFPAVGMPAHWKIIQKSLEARISGKLDR
jgi:sulfhydrogenase subunit beta (sulfur reductase)